MQDISCRTLRDELGLVKDAAHISKTLPDLIFESFVVQSFIDSSVAAGLAGGRREAVPLVLS